MLNNQIGNAEPFDEGLSVVNTSLQSVGMYLWRADFLVCLGLRAEAGKNLTELNDSLCIIDIPDMFQTAYTFYLHEIKNIRNLQENNPPR